MGISSKATRWLFEQAAKSPFTGSVLTLGVQEQSFDFSRLKAITNDANYHSSVLDQVLSSNNPSASVTDLELFKSLGFSEVIRTDFDAFEGADFTFDLGSSEGPPAIYRGKFDCIIDGGTLEHVFHTQNALKNIFDLLKPGGRIVHMSPTNNYVDHGFYSFSPTFFYEFYGENKFEIERCSFVRHTRNVEGEGWTIGEYRPGRLNHILFGGLDEALYITFFVARKTQHSTCDSYPQQGMYKEAWADGNQEAYLAALQKRISEQNAKSSRPEWIQSRFTRLAVYSDRFSKWLRKPSERRNFPIEDSRLY